MKLIVLLLSVVLTATAKKFLGFGELNSQTPQTPSKNAQDLNTFSNFRDVLLTHLDLFWDLDLDNQKIDAKAVLHFEAKIDSLSKVKLDMWNQSIRLIKLNDSSNVKFSIEHFPISEVGDQGQLLYVLLPSALSKGTAFTLTIYYSTGDQANALSFLAPEQTSTKVLPYLYSQCEPIYCRSMVPLQDTPMVKFTYFANVTAQQDLNVYMSANKTDSHPIQNGRKAHVFQGDIPIPSYLISIVAGNVVQEQVGERTYVISEPDWIKKSVNDLSELELYLTTLENYTQIPYIWGSYKIVILPPSFPFGGMENPLLTFASPSIIVGDKSGVSVAIHEIAHSWTGNMVTCGNWSNLWLNEGFTVFLERQGQIAVYGEDFMQLDAIVGNQTFFQDISDFGLQSNYSSLYPLTANTNPDDSFSTVPYEKGFQFLYYIQTLIGKEHQQKWLQGWISKYTFDSMVWQDVQEFFEGYCQQNIQNCQEDVLSKIDWETWIYTPGLPPSSILDIIEFHTEEQTQAVDLANEWLAYKSGQIPSNWQALKSFTPEQIYIFIGTFNQNYQDLSLEAIAQMEKAYDFNNSPNYEIRWRWFQVTILAGYKGNQDSVQTFLGLIGRLKMISPLYRAYAVTGQKDLALQFFHQYYDFYHPIARITISQILSDA